MEPRDSRSLRGSVNCHSVVVSHLSVRDDSGGIRVARQADWGHLGHDGIFVLDNLELVAAKELIFFLKRSHQFWRCLLIKCNGRAAVLGEGASTLSRASMLKIYLYVLNICAKSVKN